MTDSTRIRESSRRPKETAPEAALPEPFAPCPITTPNRSLERESEIRAYKLGKKRWSYNQCELKLVHPNMRDEAEIVDCMQYGTTTLTAKEQVGAIPMECDSEEAESNTEKIKESGVNFQVRLANGYRVQLNVFAVYDHPREVELPDGRIEYEWPCITRESCPRPHCEGPVLRTIQRFGKLGRRSGQNAAEANGKDGDNGMKNAKFMFISLDEAGSHVKVKHFRMIAGLYSAGTNELLGTSLSPPIRVLANNDVPTGAAYIRFTLHPHPKWSGWQSVSNYAPKLPDSMTQRERMTLNASDTHSHSSNETDFSRPDRSAQEAGHAGYAKSTLPGMLLEHANNWSRSADMGQEQMRAAIDTIGYRNPRQSSRVPSYLPIEDEDSPLKLMDPNMAFLNGIPSYMPNPSLQSTMSDFSPEMPPLGMPELVGNVSLSPQIPLGSSNPHFGMPYLQFPPICSNVYNPFSLPGPMDAHHSIIADEADYPERDPRNWVDFDALHGYSNGEPV